MVTKKDSKSDTISSGFLDDKSIWVNSNFDEKFPSTKPMFCKVGLYFDDSFEINVKGNHFVNQFRQNKCVIIPSWNFYSKS